MFITALKKFLLLSFLSSFPKFYLILTWFHLPSYFIINTYTSFCWIHDLIVNNFMLETSNFLISSSLHRYCYEVRVTRAPTIGGFNIDRIVFIRLIIKYKFTRKIYYIGQYIKSLDIIWCSSYILEQKKVCSGPWGTFTWHIQRGRCQVCRRSSWVHRL